MKNLENTMTDKGLVEVTYKSQSCFINPQHVCIKNTKKMLKEVHKALVQEFIDKAQALYNETENYHWKQIFNNMLNEMDANPNTFNTGLAIDILDGYWELCSDKYK